jgi:hypothetical protein
VLIEQPFPIQPVVPLSNPGFVRRLSALALESMTKSTIRIIERLIRLSLEMPANKNSTIAAIRVNIINLFILQFPLKLPVLMLSLILSLNINGISHIKRSTTQPILSHT